MEDPTLNQEALLLLEEAAGTSRLDDMYPETREQTLKMAGLLDRAYKAWTPCDTAITWESGILAFFSDGERIVKNYSYICLKCK